MPLSLKRAERRTAPAKRGEMGLQILPTIDIMLCDGCGQCVSVCPSGALGMAGDRAALARPDLCAYDGACELACPRGAISVPYAIVFGDMAAED
jgi:ferredoxin